MYDRIEAHAAEAAKIAKVEVAAETRPILISGMARVVAAAYLDADLRQIGITGHPAVHPAEVMRQKLPSVPDAPRPKKAGDSPKVPLHDLLRGWQATTLVKPRTLDETRYILDLLIAFLGHEDARRVSREDLGRWRDAMKAEGKTNNTWNNRLSLLRQVFAFGVSEGKLDSNPTDGMRLRKNKVRSPLPYTDEEAARILTAARDETRPSLRWAHWVMAFTGMRAGEVLQLTAGDIRQEGDIWFIAVHEDEAGKSVKTGQRRHIPIHPALQREGLVAYAQTVNGNEPLFPDKLPDKHGNRGGRAWNLLGKWTRHTVGIVDPRKAPNHSWRHRVEDELRSAEVPEDVRDAILGHARKTTGRAYGVRGEALRRLSCHLARLPVPLNIPYRNG